MAAINGLGCMYSHAQSLMGAKPASPVSSLLTSTAATPLSSKSVALLMAKNKPTIEVRPLAVKANEFPPAISNQMKVAFECTIRNAPPQIDFSTFPRHRCDLDKLRTLELNKLTIQRIDQFPSADGITIKIVVIARNPLKDEPSPTRFHAAFQLYLDQPAGNSVAVLKEFLYADAMF